MRQHLGTRLPAYMLPSAFVVLDEFPLTPSGKVDRRALPKPDLSRAEVDHEFVAPRTPLEELIAGVWSAVLGVERVSVHDNFFALGGHSLLATQVITRLRHLTERDLPLRLLFEAPTIAAFAAQIDSHSAALDLPLVAVPRDGRVLPVSYAQQRLWFLDQLDPGRSAYHIATVVRLTGTLDATALQQALTALVARHESLRTTIGVHDGQPVQVIHDPEAVPLPLVVLLDAEAATVRAQVQQHIQPPFDLQHGPLLRAALLRLDEREHVLVLVLHHIVSDGWSQSLLIRELTTLYQAHLLDEPARLPALPVQYADYALWQRQWLQGTVLEQQVSYWQDQLAAVPPLELPTDYPRPAVLTERGAVVSFALGAEVTAGLEALRGQTGATLFMTLLAAWQVLLARWSGQTDLAVGTPIAGRVRPELDGLIGFFVNTLVLRGDVSGRPSFVELVARVRHTALEAYAHQDLPFEMVVEAVQPARDLSRTPLFQVLFALQNTPRATIDLPALTVVPFGVENPVANFDLSCIVTETAQGLVGSLEYRTDLFAAETMARLAGHFQTLLAALVADPQQPIDRLPLLTTAERHQLLYDWNATRAEYPQALCLHTAIEAQVARTPDAIAVVYQDQSLTYAELNTRANRLAHYLRAQGVHGETRVGIAMEPSIELVVGVLAILKAGGAYVPLDPSYPAERLRWLFGDSQIALVLTQQHLLAALPDTTLPVVSLDRDWTQGVEWPGSNLEIRSNSDQLAYMIYTSGSTGTPKGVMIAHRGVINNLTAHQVSTQLTAADRLLLNYSISFDPSVWSIFWPLTTGAQLVLVSSETRYDTAALVRAIAEHEITIFGTTPAQLAVLVEEPGITACARVRYVVSGGDSLPRELQQRFFSRLSATLCNAYGPTEGTIDTTFWICPRTDEPQTPLIGRPLPNVQVYVLDRRMEPLPIGVPGELYIGGAGLARGYHQRPELTAERFVPDPFGETCGGRLYKTGDLVRFTADGQIEFLGRIDHQVKLRGFRIELGEIEALLAQHPAVREAVVVIGKDRPGEQRLVAYVVGEQRNKRTKEQTNKEERIEPVTALLAAPEAPPSPTADEAEARRGVGQGGRVGEGLASELRQHLGARLPEYMLPSAFVVLDALPLTTNGKLDRKALPAPDFSHAEADHEFVAPRTPLEELIANVWSAVLGVERVSVHDNFFTLGGHSLLATQVVMRLRQILEREIPLRLLFEAPSLAEFAARLTTTESAITVPLDSVPRDGRVLPVSYAQQRLWFLDQLDPGRSAYHIATVVRLTGTLDATALQQALTALVARHESLRTTIGVHDGQPVQRIHEPEAVPLPLVALLDAEVTTVRAQVQQHIQPPFDLQHGPLLRAALLRLDEREHVLVLVLHHIVSDGWSQSLLIRELTTLYQAHLLDEPARLPALPVQYADYALWQRQWLQGAVLEQQVSYWQQQLAAVPPLELPTDYPRPAVLTERGAVVSFALGAEVTAGLEALRGQTGATLFMTLLAAWQVLLARWSGQTDLAVGTPIAGRVRPELDGLIGFFVNTLVLRGDVSGRPSFVELVARVRHTALEAYAHQDLPFEMVVEAVQPARDLSRTPLFQVLFALQNTPRATIDLPALTVAPFAVENTTSKFDLSCIVTETAQGLVGSLEYRTDLFAAETMARLAGHFQTLLAALVADPHQPIDRLPLLTAAERHQLLYGWNPPATSYPRDQAVHELVAQQAARTPDAIAVSSGEAQCTYAELNARANQLAHYLQSLGVGTGTPVGICLERSLAFVVGALAILKAGGAYVPLDPSYPHSRL